MKEKLNNNVLILFISPSDTDDNYLFPNRFWIESEHPSLVEVYMESSFMSFLFKYCFPQVRNDLNSVKLLVYFHRFCNIYTIL